MEFNREGVAPCSDQRGVYEVQMGYKRGLGRKRIGCMGRVVLPSHPPLQVLSGPEKRLVFDTVRG